MNRAMAFLVGCVLVLLLAGNSVALGQAFGGLPPGFGEALQPDFATRDLKFFVEDLRLDDGQRVVMESLFADYVTAFKAGADKVRASVGALDPSGEVDDGTRNERTALIRRELEGLVDKANEDEPAESPEERAARVAQIKLRIEQLRMQLKDLSPDPPRGDDLQKALQHIGDALQIWQAKKVQLRDKFIANAQAVLKDDQKERWPALARKITREHTLNKGRLSGESVDLIRVVNEMNFTPEVGETIKPVLVEYDIHLDAALQARNAEIEKNQQRVLQATQLRDVATLAAITESIAKTRTAIRSVNDDYAALIVAKLPPDQADRFNATFKNRAYPRVYRPTQTQRLFKAAQELEGLDPKTLASIKDLEKVYAIELGPVNDRVCAVVKTTEVLDLVNRAASRNGQRNSDAGGRQDPVGEAFQERNQFGQTYADKLKSLLTEEQWQQLPAGPQGSERSARP